jgi:hypothetical protein
MSVRNGNREGLRQAIVDSSPPAPSSGPWSCPIIAPTAPAAGSDAQTLICYTKKRMGLDPAKTRVMIHFEAPYRGGQPVKMCVQYAASTMTGVVPKLMSGTAINSQVESLIEMDQTTFTAPFAETAITTWPSSCSTL